MKSHHNKSLAASQKSTSCEIAFLERGMSDFMPFENLKLAGCNVRGGCLTDMSITLYALKLYISLDENR